MIAMVSLFTRLVGIVLVIAATTILSGHASSTPFSSRGMRRHKRQLANNVPTCPTTPAFSVANDLGWQMCTNTDFNVESQSWAKQPSAAACAQSCASTDGCTTAVWDQVDTSCHIKGNPGALNYNKNDRYETIKLAYTPNIGMQFQSSACPWGQSTYNGFSICPLSDYVGTSNTIANNINRVNGCVDLCANTQGCTRAVWDTVNNQCHVKGAVEGLAQVVSKQFQTITKTSAIARKAAAKAGTTAILGTCGVTAQHLFLGDHDTVYLIDKTEASPLPKVDRSNAAVVASFSLSTRQCRPMTATTNQFCAAGGPLADGRWVSGGGNPAQNGQGQTNGLRAIRTLTPCANNGTCQWDEGVSQLQRDRWYPSAETTGDGSLIWLGGYNAQVFMPYPQSGNTPTAEYYPSKGDPISVPVLDRAWPFSLYPLTHHMSDGRIFIVSGSEAVLWNPSNQHEKRLPSMPNGPRTYPSGGSAVLLPLTPANNYTETSMLCGGNTGIDDWGYGCPGTPNAYAVPASKKCDMITPLARNAAWTSAPDMPIPRLMGTMMLLPDNTIALVNGAQAGTQGFGCGAPGESMASNPANTVYIYDPKARTWTKLATQIANRGYHSSATLLPDGSVLVAGSSPHNDISPWTQPFPSEFRLEQIFPSYYDAARPSNAKVPKQYPYGGKSFTITFDSAKEAKHAFVRLIRTGWSTHGLQHQQRSYELKRKVNGKKVTFSGMPANAKNIFPPGPALAFLVVKGVPAKGKMSVVGSGRIG